MLNITKAAQAATGTVTDAEMAAINAQAIRELSPDDVYVFHVNACDDRIDRDYERFPVDTLMALAPMFIGKPVISDHDWSAAEQVARIFSASVEAQPDGASALRLSCYMLKDDRTKAIIDKIEGGILREVSVGCRIKNLKCSICGGNARECSHWAGREYEGKTCIYELTDPIDAFELSFVAVPAQPRAGVTKSAENHHTVWLPAEIAKAKATLEIEHERTKCYDPQ